MKPETLSKLIVNLSRLTAVFGVAIVALTAASFAHIDELLSVKPFFILYGSLLVQYAVDLHHKLTPGNIHRYCSAIAVPVAIIPIYLFLGSGGTTTGLKAAIAVIYFFAIGILYKVLLAKSGSILFGEEIIE